jgi:predicted enzyme related to lactoylglutathione lyase
MSTRNEPWPEGTPCWADLSATGQQAATAFYSHLFGWQVEDIGEEMGHYGIARLDGHRAVGIGELQPDDAGPPAWTTYLASNDVDRTCETITAAGGTVVVPPMVVGAAGRMAIATDPNGATFGVWQSGEVIGSEIVNEPGAIIWNECLSRDPQRAIDFYAAVFGYECTPMEGDAYWTIDGDGPGNTIGGVGRLTDEVPAEVPAHWMTYFAVADADATATIAAQSGATVQVAPFDTPFGRMAVIRDPQGAVFSIAGALPDTGPD